MTDDLIARCLAEVERAMANEPHDRTPVRCGALLGDGDCGCTRDRRLAARFARMLAAGMHEVYVITQANAETAEMADPYDPLDAGLRAVARVREEP